MTSLRKKIPVRTCKKVYTGKDGYRRFKPFLQIDFNSRCGYCDEIDLWSNGRRGFQIDHFAPKKKSLFPYLANEYSNLIYSCFYCNNSKSDTWVSHKSCISVLNNEGFIDPCSIEYDNHLHRNNKGEILYKTTLGEYIYDELKLGLPRRSILWKVDELQVLIEEIKHELNKIDSTSHLFLKLKEQHYLLLDEFYKYFKKHSNTVDDN